MMISPTCLSRNLKTVPRKQVVLVDDDERMRRSMERLLTTEGYSVKSFPTAASFLATPALTGAVCAVVNLDMRDISGLEVQRRMLMTGRGEQVVFYTATGSIASCVQAMKAGAADYLTRPMSAPTFLQAVENALERSNAWWSQRSCQSEAETLIGSLTRREQEVMKLMIRGLMNREMANALGAAEATIKIHRRRIMDKLAVKSVPEIVILAQNAGIAMSPAAAGGESENSRHGMITAA
ncbi:MAG: response regulator [Verrucomicrobiota bacterium]